MWLEQVMVDAWKGRVRESAAICIDMRNGRVRVARLSQRG